MASLLDSLVSAWAQRPGVLGGIGYQGRDIPQYDIGNGTNIGGPAMTSITHTPTSVVAPGIIPESLGGMSRDDYGFYSKPNPLIGGQGSIQINPQQATSGNLQDTLLHEQQHVNQNTNLDAAVKAAQGAPGYQQIANMINTTGKGDPALEGPAWLTSNSPDNVRQLGGVPSSVRSMFMRGYQQALPQGQANIAQKIGKSGNTITDSDNSENRSRY